MNSCWWILRLSGFFSLYFSKQNDLLVWFLADQIVNALVELLETPLALLVVFLRPELVLTHLAELVLTYQAEQEAILQAELVVAGLGNQYIIRKSSLSGVHTDSTSTLLIFFSSFIGVIGSSTIFLASAAISSSSLTNSTSSGSWIDMSSAEVANSSARS